MRNPALRNAIPGATFDRGPFPGFAMLDAKLLAGLRTGLMHHAILQTFSASVG